MKKLLYVICALLAVIMLFSVVACTPDPVENQGKVFDNENDPLVFSTQEVDKVFNPFFSTSATDGAVVGMTQISMLSNDKKGNVVYGGDEPVVTEDLQIITTGTPDVDETTTYYFVLRPNIRFSNNTPLTIKDVLFNLYVYLDGAYTGSSTIYSTDIVGLKQYRTQQADEAEQDSFMAAFEVKAKSRINALVGASTAILDDAITNLTSEEFITKLTEYRDARSGNEAYAHIVEDYQKALELFEEELESDYSNSLNTYSDIVFTDKEKNNYKNLFTTDVEAFLYNEGYIRWNKKDAKLEYNCGTAAEVKTWTKEHAIDYVFQANIPDKITDVVTGWLTATTLTTYLTNIELAAYAEGTELTYKNISGIKFANKDEAVTVNGKTYAKPTYNDDGSVASGNEVLSITINGVDPKAIWNFAFSVAPMYYYSDAEHIAAFDYEANFGVKWNNINFMTNVIKNPSKLGVPVGAGPYAASRSGGGITGVSDTEFYNLGVIYFERNPYYYGGAPLVKKLRFQVVSGNQMLNALYSGTVDWAEPNAKPETIAELDGKKSEGIQNKSVQTAGYGYIGINAGKVPTMAVRQAIMHSINTTECVDYYKTTASSIARPMSLSNWAYPTGATPYYPFIGGKIPENLDVVNPAYKDFVIAKGKNAGETFSREEQIEFLRTLVEDAGYTLNSDDVYQNGNNVLKYTFTVAGEEQDHPAWNALFHAGQLLNQSGFSILVTTDANALKKLSNGDLTVWAAAWGSTIDPDMYQVYHMESKASSTKNWGYNVILQDTSDTYAEERLLIEELSEFIDRGRKTTDTRERTQIYKEALDIVMQLAVELPTYQRDDLFAFNCNKIDESSLNADVSAFKGLTSDIHRVSLVVK